MLAQISKSFKSHHLIHRGLYKRDHVFCYIDKTYTVFPKDKYGTIIVEKTYRVIHASAGLLEADAQEHRKGQDTATLRESHGN
jgi:hypothetical protein